MLGVAKQIIIILAVVFLNSIGTMGHVSASSMTRHHHGHAPADTGTCLSLCRSAVMSRHDGEQVDENRKDDTEPTPGPIAPVVAQVLDIKTHLLKQYAAFRVPLPKPPAYIAYGVFRT